MDKINLLNKAKNKENNVCLHIHVYVCVSEHESINSFFKNNFFSTVMKRKCFPKVKETFVPWHLPLCLTSYYVVVKNPQHL